MRPADTWKDYELLDATDGNRLERWGETILIRPDPQVVWKTPKQSSLWAKADAVYHRSNQGGGEWEYKRRLPEKWKISCGEGEDKLTLIVSPTGFKHTGVFPEQAVNWDWFGDKIRKAGRPIKVLNLFAYTGGATLAAAAADVCIVSKEGELFLTAPFTSAAAGDKLEGAGSAEFAAMAGVAAIVVDSAEEAAAKAAELVGLLPANNLAGPAVFEPSAPAGTLNLAKYCPVEAAASIADANSAVELYAGYGKTVYTALATVAGNVVGIVATKGAEDVLCRNCVSKAARFVRLCDAFSIPVVTLVNTDGFVKSASDDMAGGLREAARLAGTYADATTAKVAVITGKAVGVAYTALANADLTIAVEGCTVAPLDPKAAVTVLYKDELENGTNIAADTAKLAARYAADVCSAAAAVEAGLADMAVPAAGVRAAVVSALDMLSTKRTQRLPKKHGNMSL